MVCFFNIANWNEAHGIISFNSILFPCQKPICLTSTLGGRSNTSNWAQSKGIEGSALSNSEAFQDSKVMQAVMDFWKGSGSFYSLETVSLCLLLIAQTTTILQPVSVCLGQRTLRNWISLECSIYIYHFSHLSSIYCSPNYQTFVKSLGGGPTNRTALGLFWHWQTSSKIVARRFFLQFNLRYLQSAKLPWLHINPVLVMCQCLGLQLAYRKSCRVLLWMECQGAAVRLPKSSKTWILHDRDPTGAWSWPHWIVSESSYLAWATFWCAAADPGSKPESA